MSAAPQEPPAPRDAPDRAPQTPPRPKRLLLHVGLFLATFLTTTAAGAILMHARAGVEGWEAILPIADGLSYSLPLMLILLSHELGHYLVARWHGVDASLPYFIPLPPTFGLGTMGAVIGMRNVTSDRKKLIDIGAAGPLAGLLVAVPVILYGLHRSPVGPLVAGAEQEGNSLLYALLKFVATGAWLPDGKRDVFLHPTAWAGWVGLLVTMINLIPAVQLDGGHVAYALFGERQERYSRRMRAALLPIALCVSLAYGLGAYLAGAHGELLLNGFAPGLHWLLWWFLLRLMTRRGRREHPRTDAGELSPRRRAVAWATLALFVALFMPAWLRQVPPS